MGHLCSLSRFLTRCVVMLTRFVVLRCVALQMRYTNSNQEIPEFGITPEEALELLLVSLMSLTSRLFACRRHVIYLWKFFFTSAQMPRTHAHTQSRVHERARYPHSLFFSHASQLPRSSFCVFGCAPVCVCDCACTHCMRHAISRPKARSHTPYRMVLRLAGSQFFGRMNELAQLLFFCREVSVDGSNSSSVEWCQFMDCTSHFTPPILALFRMRGRLMSAGCLAAYTTPR